MPKCKYCKENYTPKFSSLEKCQKEDCRIAYAMEVVSKQKEKLSKEKNKPIKKVSDKRKLENIIYKSERIKFLMLPENKVCPITKQPTTDVHHSKGRIGTLYLDKRYWIALSREGHKYVEENPQWARENGFSLSRLSND
jgi:hypothetical protein